MNTFGTVITLSSDDEHENEPPKKVIVLVCVFLIVKTNLSAETKDYATFRRKR